jgi:hypothetical protein
MLKTMLATLVALGLGSLTPAFAADVKVSGVIFGQTAYDASGNTLTNNNGQLQTKISRIYLNAEAKFSPKVKTKVQLEGNDNISPVGTGTVANMVFLKYAYATYMDLLPGLDVNFGMLPTAWNGNEEKIWNYRYVAKVYLDELKLHNSSDRGLSLTYKMPAELGDAYLGVVNGEGYNKDESAGQDGSYKEYLSRVTFKPLGFVETLEGFKLHGGFTSGQTKSSQHNLRERASAGVSYEHPRGRVMYSYTSVLNPAPAPSKNFVHGTAWSLHGSLKLPGGFSVFARHDEYDADDSKPNDLLMFEIFGVDYELAEGVRIAIDNQIKRTEALTLDSETNNVMFHLEAKY